MTIIGQSYIKKLINLKARTVMNFLQKQKSKGSTNMFHESNKTHIVLCLASLQYEFLLYFLKEFYGQKRNKVYFHFTVHLIYYLFNSIFK